MMSVYGALPPPCNDLPPLFHDPGPVNIREDKFDDFVEESPILVLQAGHAAPRCPRDSFLPVTTRSLISSSTRLSIPESIHLAPQAGRVG
jgi:hypothetical protein